jgi:hypothetical protein
VKAAKTRVSHSEYVLYCAVIVLPTLGTSELIEAENLCERLLNKRLFGENRGQAIWSLFALRGIQQVVLLDLSQLVE